MKKKLRIILIAFYCEKMWEIHEELGISSIAAVLRHAGYEVMILSINESFNCESIVQFSPQIIGFTVYDINKNHVYKICNRLSDLLPTTLFCVGGALPTYKGYKMLEECPDIDVAIKGEGEKTFLEIASCIEDGKELSKVDGIIYRNGKIIIDNRERKLIEELDTLPFPARDMLLKKDSAIAQISTSRGCFARCSFCTVQLFWNKWRGRKISNVLDEIQLLVKNYKVYAFNIIDSSFEDPKLDRMLEFADGILHRKLNITYYVQMRAETHDKIREEDIILLKQSGLSSVCIGFEAGNEEDLRLYNKKASTSQMNSAVRFFQKYDINVDAGFINFNPYTNLQRLLANISFLEENGFAANPDYILKHSKIYEGTSLYGKAHKDGLLNNDSNGLGFSFKHDLIYTFYNYIKTYLQGETSNDQGIFRVLCHGASFSNVSFACLQSLLRHEEDAQAITLTDEYWRKNKQLQHQINIKISQWFGSLLCLLETGWNNDQADEIGKEYLSRESLNRFGGQYKYLWNKYLYHFSKRNIKEPIKKLANYLHN